MSVSAGLDLGEAVAAAQSGRRSRAVEVGDAVPSRRLTELDGVRGLAAVAVVCSHWLAASPASAGPVNGPITSTLFWLRRSPLGAFVAGSQMVILFFVLSGMVLALPRIGGRPIPYRRYLLTRGLRLYPAAWAAIGFSLAVMMLVGTRPGIGSTTWLQGQMDTSTSSLSFVHLFVLILPFDPSRLDAPLWSLQQELRLSLLIPVLVILTRRYNAAFIGFIAVGLIVIGTAFSSVPATLQFTPVVAGAFLLGGLLAKHRDQLNRAWGRTPGWARRLLGLAILLTFWIPARFSDVVVIGRFSANVLPAFGACVFIIAAQGTGLRDRLRRRVPAYLGRISYSLYLVHLPVLFLLLGLRPAGVAVIDLAPIGLILSLALATVMQRYIETPAIAVGRRIHRSARYATH